MNKILFLALPLLLFSCKGVEQHKAGIEELAGNWEATTKAVADFRAMVSTDLSSYSKTITGLKLEDLETANLTAEQSANLDAANKAVTDALSGYPPLQKDIKAFDTTWTEKSAGMTSLKDGLATGKIEGDVAGQLSELGSLVTAANEHLTSWRDTYSSVKEDVDTAINSLTQQMESFDTAN